MIKRRQVNWNAAIPRLNLITAGMLALNMLLVFFWAPTELTMGHVQRIFYFHVGSAWVASLAFLVALLAGVSYLRRPAAGKDAVALASVEIGLVFTTMTIASGSIWGRPAWNTWWIWTPRLISITVLWLVYAAYFMLRGAVEDEERRGRFAAVYVIAAFVTVILTIGSIRVLRDIHPLMFGESSVTAKGESEFGPGLASMRMGLTLGFSVLTFMVLYLAWLANRLRLQATLNRVEALKARTLARLQGEQPPAEAAPAEPPAWEPEREPSL
ncbi:MAG: cytochrome c biogenesis protein [Candidatus Promineifilaceae bacterium]